MNILLLGAPGCGKGTQSQYISKEYGVTHISTGDMLREICKQGTPEAVKIKRSIVSGELVSDDIVIELVKKRLRQIDYKNGLLLDGFPRTLYQVESLPDLGVEIDHVIELHVPDEVIVKRVGGRRVHPKSGRTYHILHKPPIDEGKDDITGEPLVLREDDTEYTVKMRLAEYHQQTTPIVTYYKNEAEESRVNYHRLDGTQTVDTVSNQIFEIF
ncbi:adenylate kinase [Halomonas sp. ISL-60]|uniref:adenylate kinase n=1 Tax=Halomonas sp. ISL-56 TaxID=2819149 RepID=UPI001BE9FA2D|nr:adenylate kinase [Halomonas sp. ISL-56]MBT2772750.1 adenylate kinase [Halomonas sp. ISL-60]MBT2800545.1 adenylate kinase [Halomonas sp. ISL-56]